MQESFNDGAATLSDEELNQAQGGGLWDTVKDLASDAADAVSGSVSSGASVVGNAFQRASLWTTRNVTARNAYRIIDRIW